MLTSLGWIFLTGLLLGEIARKLGLPKLVGMLLAGVLLCASGLDFLGGTIQSVSADLRKLALVIILLKAGLSLDLQDLKKVGRPALLMAFLPAAFEVVGYLLLAPVLLPVTRTEAAVLGAVMSAVSPAVVVPRMVALMEEKRGTDKGIPQMILAGASLDDVFVLVLFTAFVGMAQGGPLEVAGLLDVPVSILSGVVLGCAVGWLLAALLRGVQIQVPTAVILLLGVGCFLLAAESALVNRLAFSGLLAVMSAACVIRARCPAEEHLALSAAFGKLWLGAEVLLFVLVGAAVDVGYVLEAGPGVLLLIPAALAVRSAGVLLCLVRTPLNRKERLFCVIAYLPKATVQAAIGGIPLAMGLPCGDLVLSVAVTGILITAPLGALGIDRGKGYFLKTE